MNHVESHRLFELAHLPAILDQPEWEHIKNCADCGVAFAQLVDLCEHCYSRSTPNRSRVVLEAGGTGTIPPSREPFC